MARVDSIYETDGHNVTTSTTTFYDDLMSEARCVCGWSAGGFLSVASAEQAAKDHADGTPHTITEGEN